MAKSKCIKCGNYTFKIEKGKTVHKIIIYFVSCSKCGEVVCTITDLTKEGQQLKSTTD